MHPAVTALSLEEKGLVLGAALARTTPADLAARMPGAAGARCAAALAALAGQPRSARAPEIAALTALARAPVPAGIERVHPEWLRERFEREPAAIVRAVSAGLPDEVRRVADEVLRARGGDDARPPAPDVPGTGPGVAQLQRLVFAGLVPLAGAGAPTTPIARELAALPAAEIVRAIEARGAEALGRSLRGAPAAVAARAAASVGESLASVVLEAARGEGDPAARDRAREIVAAAGAAATGEAAFAIGAHALAALLDSEGAAAVMAIAQRLPLALGRRVMTAAGLEDEGG